MAFLLHGWLGLLLAGAVAVGLAFVAELVTGVFFYTYAQFVPEQGDGGPPNPPLQPTSGENGARRSGTM